MKPPSERAPDGDSIIEPQTPADGDQATRATSDTAPTYPTVLNVDELAALLRMDRKSVYAAIQRREIPGVRRIGRAVRISREAVLQWLSTGQGAAPRSRRDP